jgi:GTPase
MNPKQKPPSLAIVGRVNVGKSTLFNRLSEERKALVSTVPGTTRDRVFGSVIWRGKMFVAVDTAGIDVPERELRDKVRHQVEIALRDADQILLLVDVTAGGPTTEDRELAKIVRNGKKPLILGINKCDGPARQAEALNGAWKQLGIETICPLSAINGTGVGDMLDVVMKAFNKTKKRMPLAEEKPATKLAFIGQPNVGKSSIVNALLGEERVVVSEFPGTTREPIDTFVLFDKHPFLIIDTVGIQRKAKASLEATGVKRSLEAAHLADVVALVLDATRPPTSQDRSLAGELIGTGKGAMIIVNKWDLVPDKTTKTMNEYREMVRGYFPFMQWVPIVFASAKTSEKVNDIFTRAITISEERGKTIPPEKLEQFLRLVQTARAKGMGVAHPKTYRFDQTAVNPPTFLLVAKGKLSIPDAYTNFLEKRLRERFGFIGTPVRMLTKKV